MGYWSRENLCWGVLRRNGRPTELFLKKRTTGIAQSSNRRREDGFSTQRYDVPIMSRKMPKRSSENETGKVGKPQSQAIGHSLYEESRCFSGGTMNKMMTSLNISLENPGPSLALAHSHDYQNVVTLLLVQKSRSLDPVK